MWWEGELCLSPPVPSRHIHIDPWDVVSVGGSTEGTCDGARVLLLLFSSQKATSLWGQSLTPLTPANCQSLGLPQRCPVWRKCWSREMRLVSH